MRINLTAVVLLLLGLVSESRAATDFDTFLKPLFAESCLKCHGEKKVKGKVNLKEITSAQQFLAKPELIEELIEVIDASDMPPEEEPQLADPDRVKLLATLKAMLSESTAGQETKQVQIRRLNRFQYNNSIKDLFQLKSNVFPLREKLMTRYGNYLNPPAGKMPDQVRVACDSLNPSGGLREVKAFPMDLRAAHGFDNQANQLTLSPLLLDAFLLLSVSILDSPDFNEGTVGVWNAFFKEPAAGVDLDAEVKARLEPFLMQAFRSRVDPETLERYTAYALSKIKGGLSFTDSMKKVASAVLSSPMFLYRYGATTDREDLFVVASNLSFFLWSSGPDLALLRLAESGELGKSDAFNRTVEQMMADPRIERFLDTFPSQWMQLANVLAATPDPKKARLFSLDKDNPAGTQMLLEPLLLFDAVFIENRPIVELIAPKFSYRSDFLTSWYTTDLKPEPINQEEVSRENKVREEKLKLIEAGINTIRAQLEALHQGTDDFLKEKSKDLNLSPGYKKWEAEQSQLVTDSVVLSPWHRIGPFSAGNFDQAHAKAFIRETAVDLKKTYKKLVWTEAKELVDGKVHQFSGDNSAVYLYRTLQSDSARSLEASLGTDDSFKIWLNGKLVVDKKVTRGVAPDQDRVRLDLAPGENKLLLKVANGGGGFGFYFKTQAVTLPGPVVAALKVPARARNKPQWDTLASHYRSIAPELASARQEIAAKKTGLENSIKKLEGDRNRAPKPQGLRQHQEDAQRRFDDELRNKMRSQNFVRVEVSDPRYGGVITNAAMLSMTSGPTRTHPIARGAWMIEVIFNDPPPPPPNDVPPLNEESSSEKLTIREKFAKHRENPDCAGCHSRLDPLGFALENYDIIGRWRDKYENGRDVDSSGTLMKKYEFDGIVRFKESLVKENRRFAKAFAAHLLRFALSKELSPKDSLTVEAIVNRTEKDNFKLRAMMREVIRSESFLQGN